MTSIRLICDVCGGSDVDILAWVNINTNKFSSEGPEDETYCNSCKTENCGVTEEIYTPPENGINYIFYE